MKLARITKPLRAVPVRVVLNGGLNARLERYAQFYEHVHGEAVAPRSLIPEILRACLDADREFLSWSRSAQWSSRSVTSPASSNGNARA